MLYEKYEPPVTKSQVPARVPGESTGNLSYGTHPGRGLGMGDLLRQGRLPKLLHLLKRILQTHLGLWLCGHTLYSQEVDKRLLVYGG